MIRFPGAPPPQTEESRVLTPKGLFTMDEDGRLDLADGLTVSDAVTDLWLTLEPVVREAWAGTPLAREKARVQILTGYLDKHRPLWREELVWRFE